MKIAVITMQAVKNYGSVLQTYATQSVFLKKGHDVEIINYIREKNLDSNLSDTWTKNEKGVKKIIKKMVLFPTLQKWKKVFNRYLHKYIKTTSRIYSNENDLLNNRVNADIFCTGSDQVWNSGWNEGIEKPFYLSFVPDDVPKISLAASIGKSDLSETECNVIMPYLKRYNHISIREMSSMLFLRSLGLENVDFCLDPTLLLSKEEWMEHSEPYLGVPEKFILVYQLNHDSKFDAYAEEVAKRKGLPLYRICTRYDQARLPGKPIFIPKVEQFVYLLEKATLVLTNSFHASAFCINLNTNFVSICPNEYSCRITDLLDMFSLSEKRLKSYDDFNILDIRIDYKKTNSILTSYRAQSLKLIDDMISEC